jgi:hypothetical protein
MAPDSRQGRLLRPYSYVSTLLQLFVIGEGIERRKSFISQDNNVICYEGIQRIYRNAMIRFIRSRLCDVYPQNFEAKLRAPFQKEWEGVRQHALESRQSGELDVPLIDDFDFLSVNHFFQSF